MARVAGVVEDEDRFGDTKWAQWHLPKDILTQQDEGGKIGVISWKELIRLSLTAGISS